jgi:hypothetical protein
MRISALTICTLLATTALATPVYGLAFSAQARQFPDENGVDVVTGKANIAGGAVSIGRPGDSGMAYSYGWSGGVYTDTFDLTMYNQPFDGSQPVAFTIFGQQKRLNYVSGAWQSFDGDGSTFVEDSGINGFRYTARDGTVFTFLKSLADSGWQAQIAARVSTIAFPSGEVWTYTYSLHAGENIPSFPEPIIYPAMGRVLSVNSTFGYQL